MSKLINLLLRYFIIVVFALSNFYILYLIFTPLTIYLTKYLLQLFYEVLLVGNILFIGEHSIEIIEACVAGAAYFLLIALNFATPMKLSQRIKSIIFSTALFFVINVLRIVIFSVLIINSFKYFDLTHMIFWYFLSTVFIVLIWFITVKIYKIKDIPAYTDIKYLYSNSLFAKNSTKNKSK
ncbi:MAG: pacearchaeosortase [Nanoarchaeota archaeon]|nr:pacearchaeosortase [Nanoarchaeota archaeon]